VKNISKLNRHDSSLVESTATDSCFIAESRYLSKAKKEEITIKPELSLEPLFERVAVGGERLTLMVVHFSICSA
jgi:hypothetical protein